MSTARERLTWHSIFQPLITAALLLAFTGGAIYLHKGWQSAWRKQTTVGAKQTYVPPVDPALARDPSVQAAKMKVIGPLANEVQVPEESTNPNAAEPTEPVATASAIPANVDLLNGFRELPPLHLFRGRISVEGYRDLQFEIPPHASLPRLSGTYKTLSTVQGPASGVLLLSEQQFHDFFHGGSGDAVLASEGLSGVIDVALSPTHVQSQKYHLLLHSSSAHGVPVQADFIISFE